MESIYSDESGSIRTYRAGWGCVSDSKTLIGEKRGERNHCLDIVQMLILTRVVHNSYSGSLMQAQILLK